MKSAPWLKPFFVLALFILTSEAFAQEMQDVVYLKNGSIIRGLVIEQVPGKSLKIKTRDGSVFVYTMEEVEKITKEEVAATSSSPSSGYYEADRFVVGLNPLGFIVGGISWISYERYVGNNFTYQIRGDIWTYGEEENDGGYYYKEDQTGFGAGVSGRGYVLGGQPFSGLFGGFGIDAVFTSWNWEERYTTFSPTNIGDGSTFTLVLSAQLGFAIAVSNVRLEPSLVTGYFLLREKGAGVVGVFVAPAFQVSIMF